MSTSHQTEHVRVEIEKLFEDFTSRLETTLERFDPAIAGMMRTDPAASSFAQFSNARIAEIARDLDVKLRNLIARMSAQTP